MNENRKEKMVLFLMNVLFTNVSLKERDWWIADLMKTFESMGVIAETRRFWTHFEIDFDQFAQDVQRSVTKTPFGSMHTWLGFCHRVVHYHHTIEIKWEFKLLLHVDHLPVSWILIFWDTFRGFSFRVYVFSALQFFCFFSSKHNDGSFSWKA